MHFRIFLLAFLSAVASAAPTVTLRALTGRLYVAEDTYYARENSLVFVGDQAVTVIGATWTPETAQVLACEIAKVTHRPIRDVVNTNYHPDRAGGNAFWLRTRCRIHATQLTRDLLVSDWDAVMQWTRTAMPGFPSVERVLPTDVHPGDFALEDGRIQAFYLGPSHTKDGLFVYFPEEQVLYGGCILKEQLGNLSFADLAEYPKTLRKLQARHLAIQTIIAGHGEASHGPNLIDHYLGLLEKAGPPVNAASAARSN